jgi:hypothetical protein
VTLPCGVQQGLGVGVGAQPAGQLAQPPHRAGDVEGPVVDGGQAQQSGGLQGGPA